jgi:hypothetical protein
VCLEYPGCSDPLVPIGWVTGTSRHFGTNTPLCLKGVKWPGHTDMSMAERFREPSHYGSRVVIGSEHQVARAAEVASPVADTRG